MNAKEEFMNQALQLQDQLHQLENKYDDFYYFKQCFEQEINQFGNQVMQEMIGSKRKDRREKNF